MINIVHVSYSVLYIIEYISRYISDFIYVSDTVICYITQHTAVQHILYNYQQNRLVTKGICSLHTM